jgi:hypothetical protein
VQLTHTRHTCTRRPEDRRCPFLDLDARLEDLEDLVAPDALWILADSARWDELVDSAREAEDRMEI